MKDKPAARRIVVVGSLNMDLVVRVPHLPSPGETISGGDLASLPGGKGANQAVACARLGARVAMVGCVGDDAAGRTLLDTLAADGVDVAAISREAAVPTGVAMIWVDDSAQNCIVLSAGANGWLSAGHVDAAEALLREAALLVVQLEVPMPTVLAAIALARRHGVPVLLNPAPAAALPATLWPDIDCLVANETEAALLTGQPVDDVRTAEHAARNLRGLGVRQVLVTLGAAGVVLAVGETVRHLPALAVRAVDTTAAGDTFIGGLAAALAEGEPIEVAAAWGQQAAALCVTRAGAMPSIPWRRELPPPARH